MTALPLLDAARRRPGWALAAAAAVAFAAARNLENGKPAKAVAYAAVVLLGCVAADLLEGRRRAAGGPPPPPLPVRRPRLEASLLVLFALVGLAALAARFLGEIPYAARPGAHRVALLLAMLVFAFPVAAAGLLLALRYGPRDLGFVPRGLGAGAAALALAACGGLLADRDRVTLWHALRETGGPGALALVAIPAAVSEEFLRCALQTRIGAALRSPAAGWWLASALWALLHVPNFAAQSDGNLAAGLLGAARILPIGLLWGYLTHRTGSLLPACLAHAGNLWGIQNP